MGQFIELNAAPFPAFTPHLTLPGSKSMSNRLLIMRKLSQGKVEIEGLSEANDSLLLQNALEHKHMDMGDAGTALRFGLAWAAVQNSTRTLSGTDRLNERPIAPLADALIQMGAEIKYLKNPGFAPLEITGSKLNGGKIKIDGSLSSQFLSALMLIAPYCMEGCQFALEKNQVSKPYILLTAELMKKAGASIQWDENEIHIAPGNYHSCRIHIEADWSAAAFFYSFVALNPGSSIFLKNLEPTSHQGDRACLDLFRKFGVTSEIQPDGILINHSGKFAKNLSIDFTSIPDLAQAVAITAAGLRISLEMKGLSTLRHKETDRISALQSELAKFGVYTSLLGDDLLIGSGFQPELSPVINTFDDHRMAMGFAALAAKCPKFFIDNPKVVAKSFPNFWSEFMKLGVDIKTYT